MRYQSTTKAILGADTVVGQALSALLEEACYGTVQIDAYPTGVVDELLDGSDLLLVVPRLDRGVREAFLGAMGRSLPQRLGMPVISLSTASTEERPPGERTTSVPWPCKTEDLVGRIEAALLASSPGKHPR